jgi:hypothetical protein
VKSGAEAFAARTTAGGVGITDLKPAFLECFDVIQFAAGDVHGAFGIDDDAYALTFDEDIAIGWAFLQFHFVLEPGTPAAHDGHAQYALREALFGEETRDSAGGGWGDSDDAFIALAEGDLGWGRGFIGSDHCRMQMISGDRAWGQR